MLATLALASPLSARQPRPAPQAIVAAIYKAEQASLNSGSDPPWFRPERFFDARLSALFRADDRRKQNGNLMFDPFCVGQDCLIERLAITPRSVNGGKAIVDVRLRNMGKPIHLVFALALGSGGWRVSEITQPGKNGFILSAVLSGER